MDKREALFHVFSIVCKCDTANDCKNCLYYGDKENPCLVQFALDAGASHDKAALQRISELWEEAVDKDKDNKQTYVPLENVGSIIAHGPSTIEELCLCRKKDGPIVVDKTDNVNRPKHYLKGGLECIQVIKAQLTPEQYKGYLYGNVLKYMWRWPEKNGIEDLRKAAHYLMWLQEEVKKND